MPSHDLTPTANTAIIGAGITGLCVAHSLHHQASEGQSFDLIEASSEVGGAIQSTLNNGYLAEHGPNSILLKDKRIAKLLQKSSQQLSPCVTINGEMLADVSGDEVEQYLLDHSMVKPVEDTADSPTDSGCVDH